MPSKPKSKDHLFKLNFIRLIVALLVSLVVLETHAQDAQFSQFYANPLYLNPALAGSSECGRVHLNYRNQWPTLTKAFITYNVSYDQSLPSINSGFGILVMNDRQGDGALGRTSASAFYSYKLKVSEPIVISFGVKAGFYQERLDWDKLVFADQINSATGVISPGSMETPPSSKSISVVDFSAGAVMSYWDMFFVGVAVDHLNEPQMTFYDDPSNKIPMKITAHGGAVVNLSQGTLGNAGGNDFVIQPNILYMQQNKFHQLNLGFYLSRYPFVVGGWFRHNFENPDAVIALVGLTWDNLRFGYSYDVTVSKIGGSSGGAHEISLAWNFCIYKEQKRRRIRAIKSPTF